VYKNEIIPHKEKRKKKSMKTNSKKSNVEGHKKDQSHLMSIFKTHDPSHETKINLIEAEKKKKQNSL
jgi:hypothetical protein